MTGSVVDTEAGSSVVSISLLDFKVQQFSTNAVSFYHLKKIKTFFRLYYSIFFLFVGDEKNYAHLAKLFVSALCCVFFFFFQCIQFPSSFSSIATLVSVVLFIHLFISFL